MGQLGDVLELFFGRVEPFRTVRATIRQRRDIALSDKADNAAEKLWGRMKIAAGTGGPESRRITERILSVWMSCPSRARVEERSTADPFSEPSLKVVDGDSWTTRDPEGHVETGKGNGQRGPSLTDIERHF